MPIPTFNLGYPQDNTSLGASKTTIRNNIDGTFQAFSVDHRDQNESDAGYHDIIHQIDQGAAPTPIVGVNQVFSMVPPSNIPAGDVQLFSLTGGGGLSQLTGNLNALKGYQWIGGVLLQWGFSPVLGATSGNGDITFAIPFPTVIYNIQATVSFTSTSNSEISLSVKNLSPGNLTKFSYNYNHGSSNYDGVYFIAIGN